MTDSRWKNLALELIGCFVSALGLYSFAVAAGVPVTGVAGIGAILFRLFGLPIGVTNIIMNIPIVLICFKYLGKDFFFRSVRCMVLFAIFTDYVLAALPVYQGDPHAGHHLRRCDQRRGGCADLYAELQHRRPGFYHHGHQIPPPAHAVRQPDPLRQRWRSSLQTGWCSMMWIPSFTA